MLPAFPSLDQIQKAVVNTLDQGLIPLSEALEFDNLIPSYSVAMYNIFVLKKKPGWNTCGGISSLMPFFEYTLVFERCLTSNGWNVLPPMYFIIWFNFVLIVSLFHSRSKNCI